MPHLYLELPLPYWERPDEMELDETKEADHIIIILMAPPETDNDE